jgi:hypothetical protein
MNPRQHPNRFAVDLSRQTKIVVICQPGRSVAEQFVHSGGRTRVASGNVVPHINTVLLCFLRPNNLHVLLATLARRVANSTSISSFGWPMPACIDLRPDSILRCRNSL